MGGGDGQGGIFTWREKHGRKVSWLSAPLFFFHRNLPLTVIAPCALGSSHTLCKSLSELSSACSVAHGARCVIYYDTTDAAQIRTVRAHNQRPARSWLMSDRSVAGGNSWPWLFVLV